jgi:YD repeat-containing protein
MKKLQYFFILLFSLTLLIAYSGKAQTSYTFGYDASGNRTSRTISLKSAFIPQNDTIVAKKKTFEDLIGNREVKIYPNPTQGQLQIELPYVENLNATLRVYGMQGALIREVKVKDFTTNVDLSRYPNGMYILKISIDDLSSEWRIIKD